MLIVISVMVHPQSHPNFIKISETLRSCWIHIHIESEVRLTSRRMDCQIIVVFEGNLNSCVSPYKPRKNAYIYKKQLNECKNTTIHDILILPSPLPFRLLQFAPPTRTQPLQKPHRQPLNRLQLPFQIPQHRSLGRPLPKRIS